MPSFVGYHRFEYRCKGGRRLIWDNQTNDWSEIGGWSTRQQADACAYGMNKAREICESIQRRTVEAALRDLRQIVKALEGMTDA